MHVHMHTHVSTKNNNYYDIQISKHIRVYVYIHLCARMQAIMHCQMHANKPLWNPTYIRGVLKGTPLLPRILLMLPLVHSPPPCTQGYARTNTYIKSSAHTKAARMHVSNNPHMHICNHPHMQTHTFKTDHRTECHSGTPSPVHAHPDLVPLVLHYIYACACTHHIKGKWCPPTHAFTHTCKHANTHTRPRHINQIRFHIYYGCAKTP